MYHRVVEHLLVVCDEHWGEITAVSGKRRNSVVEKLILKTKTNEPVYPEYEKQFHKFPCYLRRSAIARAIGLLSSYRSNLENWEKSHVGRKPSFPKAGGTFPVLYRGNCYRKADGNKYSCEIKVFMRNTWDWLTVELRKSDVDYIERHCSSRAEKSPSLIKRGKQWFLSFPYEEKADLVETVETIVSVDLGINNACVLCVMRSDGTILGRHFLSLPGEQDSLKHALNRIRQAQQHGNFRMPRLWAKAKGINADIASKTATFIMYWAACYNADCIVFEFLDLNRKKRGSKKQKLHMWKARAVQRIVTDKAHRMQMRVSHVCAWGTSKFAYDGSGIVQRDKNNYSMCTFASGKRYHADLSASYNIGARYFIREIVKSLPETARLACEAKVPRIAKRSTCTLSDLISLNAELKKIAS